MNFFKTLLLYSVSASLLISTGCTDISTPTASINNNSTAHSSIYQPQSTLDLIQKEIRFWTDKMEKTPSSTSYHSRLAGAYAQHFDATGDIQSLKMAETLLTEAMEKEVLNPAGIRRSLARNYISQHRFNEALQLVEQAYEIGHKKDASRLMLFDVHLELGNTEKAIAYLEAVGDKEGFNYIIRQAKWSDHEGHLDQTIALMNDAKIIAEESKNKGLMNWVYSNLGDYYGHNGEIEKSRSMFEKAIEIDPSDWYSMKGLAWIEFSHENDVDEAMQLLSQIETTNQTPDIALLKADIERIKGNEIKANELEAAVATLVAQQNYGVMYNGFLFDQKLQNNRDLSGAMRLAEKEMEVRQTPDAYAMMADVLAASGKVKQAKEIIKTQVIPKTYEPGVLSNQLDLFADDAAIKNYLLEQVKDARFELGPIEFQKVQKHITKS